MLEFPNDFFEDEVRDDFFVSSTMKRYWAGCLDIVKQIELICKRHDIQYYADWGTLLGAIRHKGFIPWDDDMDICVKRPDYERLIKYLEVELPPDYTVYTPFNNPKHPQFFAGVRNGKKFQCNKERINKFYGIPFVATIDIFPLDYLPRDKELADVIKDLFIIIWNVVDLIQKNATTEEIESAVCTVEEVLNVQINRCGNIRTEMWKLANQLVSSFTEEESDYLVPWCYYVNNNERIFEKKWFDKAIELPFEMYTLPVPIEYEKVVGVLFKNWKTPVKGGQAHDYPCFKNQIQMMRDWVEENVPKG